MKDQVAEEVYSRLLTGDDFSLPASKKLLANLTNHEQKILLYALIRVLSKRPASRNDALLRGVGSLISSLTSEAPILQGHLVSWLVGTQVEAVGQNNIMHRAVVLAISVDIGESFQANEALTTHGGFRSSEKCVVEGFGYIQ